MVYLKTRRYGLPGRLRPTTLRASDTDYNLEGMFEIKILKGAKRGGATPFLLRQGFAGQARRTAFGRAPPPALHCLQDDNLAEAHVAL
jgi:hypothetical protein